MVCTWEPASSPLRNEGPCGNGLGVSFAAASAQRLRTLIAPADGTDHVDEPRLPYEWLPGAIVAIVAPACHLSGLSPFA